MTDEEKQIVTRRLTQCNRSELVVIMYDILFAHLSSAREAHGKRDDREYAESLRLANQVIDRLIQDLNFKYDISKQLYSLYVYSREQIAKAMYENRLEKIDEVERLLRRLSEAFGKIAQNDTSGPLMSNTQQVYAGMTYGKSSINENLVNADNQRGFLV